MLKKKNKKEKVLSALIAFSFAISSFGYIPAYAADYPSGVPTPNVNAPSVKSAVNNPTNDTDSGVKNNVDNGSDKSTLDKQDLDENGKPKSSSKEEKVETLAEANKKLMDSGWRDWVAQQLNGTSENMDLTYSVYDGDNNIVTVRKNPCYHSDKQACQQNITMTYTDSDGKEKTITRSKTEVEYISDNNQNLTTAMLNQVKAQAKMMQSAINTAEDGQKTSNDVASATIQSLIPMFAESDMSTGEKMAYAMMAVMNAQNNQKITQEERAYDDAVKAVEKAKATAVVTLNSEEQKKNNVIKQDENSKKRFTLQINPTMPFISDTHNVEMTLLTKSGKPNDDKSYTIKAYFTNLDTGSQASVDVIENVPFVVEIGKWKNRKPGERKVKIVYTFTGNSGEPETYVVSYTVGQMVSSILPDGRNVSNSVTALASNAPYINYNAASHQAVAGRIKDAAWDSERGICMLSLTDSKVSDASQNYPVVNIETTAVNQQYCNANLVNKGEYAIFDSVTAKLDSNGQYVFMDESSNGGSRIVTEDIYSQYEDKNAADTQASQKDGDGEVLRVDETTGKIYEALPGELGVNFVFFQDTGKSVAISIDSDGTPKFSKADGTPYTPEEWESKGMLDQSNYHINRDENSGLYYVTDASGKMLTGAFTDTGLSNLSKSVRNGQSESSFDMSKLRDKIQDNSVFGDIARMAKNAVNSAVRRASSIAPAITTYNSSSAAEALKTTKGNTPSKSLQNKLVYESISQSCMVLNAKDCNKLKERYADNMYLNY